MLKDQFLPAAEFAGYRQDVVGGVEARDHRRAELVFYAAGLQELDARAYGVEVHGHSRRRLVALVEGGLDVHGDALDQPCLEEGLDDLGAGAVGVEFDGGDVAAKALDELPQAGLERGLAPRDDHPIDPAPVGLQVCDHLVEGHGGQFGVADHQVGRVAEGTPEVAPWQEDGGCHSPFPLDEAGGQEALDGRKGLGGGVGRWRGQVGVSCGAGARAVDCGAAPQAVPTK